MKQISAMMAGIVVKILVKEGNRIKEGQEVAILESMKMELPVPSNLAESDISSQGERRRLCQ